MTRPDPDIDPREHKGLVLMVARKFRQSRLPLDDLIHEGYLGVIRAARRHDPGRGTRFSTLAHFYILQAIWRAAAGAGWPESARYQVGKEAGRALRGEVDPGTLDGRQAEQYLAALAARESQPVPIGWWTAAAPDEHDDAPGPRPRLDALLSTLDDRTARVIRLRYGYDDGRALSLRAVAAAVGLSQEGVRHVEARGLRAMRAAGAKAVAS